MTDLFDPAPALGLTRDSTNREICKTAFDFVQQVGYMVIGTTALDGVTPTSRGLELHKLDDSGLFYLGVAKGKPVYFELMQHPFLVGTLVRTTVKRLSASVRISAHVTPVDPIERPDLYQRYWELNPGTKALYHKDLDMFRLFLLDRGEGEVFHLPEDDVVCRLRFSFGGAEPRPWAFEITERCVGCGACAQACMEEVIHKREDGRFHIDHFGCLECGRCYFTCPHGAIDGRQMATAMGSRSMG